MGMKTQTNELENPLFKKHNFHNKQKEGKQIMANVVLIGATGFVGSAILIELLSRGHKVTAVVRNVAKLPKNDNLTAVEEDVANVDAIANIAKGKDAVISAYNPGWNNPQMGKINDENYPKIVEAVKKSGVKRLLIVGGAGTLFVKPGVRVVDTGVIPDAIIDAVRSLGNFYLNYLTKEHDLDWVFFSPAGAFEDADKGKRTGKFRLGKDDLIVDPATGTSHISVQDYAIAMVDELEKPAHHKERFTIGY